MPPRQRQFSEIRSQQSSRCMSQVSEPRSIIQSLSFQSSTHQNLDCFGCVNKKMTLQKREQAKRKAQLQIQKDIENIKRINAIKDHQKQHRHKMLLQSAQYNKSLAALQRESFLKIKKHEDAEIIDQIKQKDLQLARSEENLKRSRLQLKEKYKEEITNQLQQQKSCKQLELSRSRISDLSDVNNLKVIEESEKYHNSMKEKLKKCQQQNKKILLERSFQKLEERQKKVQEQTKHVERVQQQLQKFTQFQPIDSSPYRTSRSILSSSQNPEDIFTELKRIETEKTFAKVTLRKQDNNERMRDLKKQEEQSRALMQKKLSSMKSYVDELTTQVLQKRQRKAKQIQYTKNYQPKKSRADYFTEQQKKKVQPCNSCEKVYETKLLGNF